MTRVIAIGVACAVFASLAIAGILALSVSQADRPSNPCAVIGMSHCGSVGNK